MAIENILEHSDELMAIARSVTGGGSKFMKVIYARRPLTDVNTGKAIQMAGWVTWIDDDVQTGELWRKMAMGWVPLRKYGFLGTKEGEADPEGNWAKILKTPGGPSEFPVDQLLEFGWFDPERVPVHGVKFPQLRGMKIPLYPCPECSDRMFQKPIHLARHCRNAHSYDRKDIQDLAEQLDINLVKEMYGDRQKLQTYDYTDDQPEPEPVVAPDFEVEPIAVTPRARFLQKAIAHERPPDPATAKKSQWTPERRAEASRKARERIAAGVA
jgi:hypothetical protein